MWGRLLSFTLKARAIGNTPTCVGKTNELALQMKTGEKHPHVCGEDPTTPIDMFCALETPPRVWGRPSSNFGTACGLRNTPTCVGKTVMEIL